MKRRMRLLYTITHANGSTWRGDCPGWAYPWGTHPGARPLPEGSTLTVTPVLWVGAPWPCSCPLHRS